MILKNRQKRISRYVEKIVCKKRKTKNRKIRWANHCSNKLNVLLCKKTMFFARFYVLWCKEWLEITCDDSKFSNRKYNQWEKIELHSKNLILEYLRILRTKKIIEKFEQNSNNRIQTQNQQLSMKRINKSIIAYLRWKMMYLYHKSKNCIVVAKNS